MLTPRDYQEACIKAHFTYFNRKRGNPLFVVPTGGGKSLIIAEFVRRTIEQWPTQRVIILTHVKELIEQNYDEFLGQWGLLAPVGIYSAGLNRRDTGCSVTFAGIQSVWPHLSKEDDPPKAAVDLGAFDLALIDEAHLLPKTGEGRYRSYLDWLEYLNPKLKVLGYTATPFRLEGGELHKGEGRIFTDIAYDVPVKKLIEDDYLAPLIAKLPSGTIDTSGVGKSRGDFKPGELEAAAMAGDNVHEAVDEMVEKAKENDRKHWLVFACGISHAELIVELVREHGVSCELLTGKTPKEERRKIVRDAKAGDITCLVNVGVLTTGFNWPRCDMLAVMRPTQSTSLYVQIMGRGMRTFPGKENCLVLDYGENVLRHGPINRINITTKEKGEGEAPVKVCPECDAIVHAAVNNCDQCGFEFPKKDPVHTPEAGKLAPIDFSVREPKRETLDCTAVYYDLHSKPGKPNSLKVTYMCGWRRFCEWICLEHTGYAQRKAQGWWAQRGSTPVPVDIYEALERKGELEKPTSIIVQEDGKYDRIVDAIFGKRSGDADSQGAIEGRTDTSSERGPLGPTPPIGRPW